MHRSKLRDEFVSEDGRKYKFKIGKRNASALSGFIAGMFCATMIWLAVVIFMNLLR